MHAFFIAEVKTQSPFGFVSGQSWHDLLDLAANHGDAVAVHTDKKWGGSFKRLAEARAILDHISIAGVPHKLLLAKGIHSQDDDIRRALDCGADLVLVVGREPPRELRPVCIYEPSTLKDLINTPISQKVMWNQRDLATGQERKDTSFHDARRSHSGWLCQASFIRFPEDVDPRTDAFIVGERLPDFCHRLRCQ